LVLVPVCPIVTEAADALDTNPTSSIASASAETRPNLLIVPPLPLTLTVSRVAARRITGSSDERAADDLQQTIPMAEVTPEQIDALTSRTSLR
jgi:hypothetical protein